MNQVGEGWIYYSFTNPATGRDEPKASYLKSIDWDGALATIGAGIYRRDLPGTCRSEEVNAMGLDADPSKEKLQEFVRCAAMELESQGYFAVRSLTTDPRWGNGSIYLFGVDTYGSSLFNGDPFSRLYGVSDLDTFQWSGVAAVRRRLGIRGSDGNLLHPGSGHLHANVTTRRRVAAPPTGTAVTGPRAGPMTWPWSGKPGRGRRLAWA